MKAAKSFDITAKSSAELIANFDVKVTEKEINLREKSATNPEITEVTLPKYLFREDVIRDLEGKAA